jgi:biotin transport system substrate-specific component
VEALPRPRLAVRATTNALGVALFVALMTVGAKVSMPLVGSPVPVTLQTLFVPLAGLTLGPWLGAAAMAAYVGLGLCGAPVFAMGGGPGYVLLPSFGYLLGFAPAAWVAGWLGRGRRLDLVQVTVAILAGHAVVFCFGVPFLAMVGGTGWQNAWLGGFFPFLPGLWYKTVMGLAAAAAGWTPARLAWPYFSTWDRKATQESTES